MKKIDKIVMTKDHFSSFRSSDNIMMIAAWNFKK